MYRKYIIYSVFYAILKSSLNFISNHLGNVQLNNLNYPESKYINTLEYLYSNKAFSVCNRLYGDLKVRNQTP